MINQHYNYPPKIGAHISEDKARLDFIWDGNISESFDLIKRELDRIVDANVDIISDFSDVQKEIRYWEIAGFARVHCGGTHLRTTGEIGSVLIKRNNIGKNKERMEITLKDQ